MLLLKVTRIGTIEVMVELDSGAHHFRLDDIDLWSTETRLRVRRGEIPEPSPLSAVQGITKLLEALGFTVLVEYLT